MLNLFDKQMKVARGTARRLRRNAARTLWQNYNAALHTDNVISLATYMRLQFAGAPAKL